MRRLFATACCHRVVHVISNERIHRIVEMSEAYADGTKSAVDLDYECLVADGARRWEGPVGDAQRSVLEALERLRSNNFSARWVSIRTAEAVGQIAFGKLDEQTAWRPANRHGRAYGDVVAEKARVEEHKQQAALLRCIFGNPFRPVALDPAWRTEAVVGLAAGIYADRAFDRLPVLADALEDAGCADADVLGHCRGPGPHARGCWVVDLLLGKT
jgi:hypothetical protein